MVIGALPAMVMGMVISCDLFHDIRVSDRAGAD